jgi:hypothetical protein
LDDALRTQIVLAAVTSAGPADPADYAGWQARVADMAVAITAACQPGSQISKVVEQVAASKRFVATVLRVARAEDSSTRAMVTLRTSPNEHHPDGTETARTERTDDPAGLRMARRLQKLQGHKVLLWVEVEQMANSSHKSRVIRYVEDLGPDLVPVKATQAAS